MSDAAIQNGEVELPPEDDAYVQSMIAKADGVETPPAEETPQKGEQPLLAGKFKTAADLEKAYKELESKLGQRAPEPPKAPEAGDKPNPESLTIEQAKEVVQEAGLDFAKLEAEFHETGDLSKESREALAKKGIGPELVDAFLHGQRAAETLGRQKVFEAVGGEQNYRNMIAWAAQNLAPDEIEAFNEVARGTNFAALRMAASGLYARFEASEGREPRLLGGGTRPAADVYESWEQVRADMRDPRYDRDEAFRAKVEAKLSRSNI